MAGNQQYSVKTLEEKHMISILIYLLENGDKRKIDIYNGVSSNPRMPDKLDLLEDMGLITQQMDMINRATIVSLTPKGEQVASMLVAIDKCIRPIARAD